MFSQTQKLKPSDCFSQDQIDQRHRWIKKRIREEYAFDPLSATVGGSLQNESYLLAMQEKLSFDGASTLQELLVVDHSDQLGLDRDELKRLKKEMDDLKETAVGSKTMSLEAIVQQEQDLVSQIKTDILIDREYKQRKKLEALEDTQKTNTPGGSHREGTPGGSTTPGGDTPGFLSTRTDAPPAGGQSQFQSQFATSKSALQPQNQVGEPVPSEGVEHEAGLSVDNSGKQASDDLKSAAMTSCNEEATEDEQEESELNSEPIIVSPSDRSHISEEDLRGVELSQQKLNANQLQLPSLTPLGAPASGSTGSLNSSSNRGNASNRNSRRNEAGTNPRCSPRLGGGADAPDRPFYEQQVVRYRQYRELENHQDLAVLGKPDRPQDVIASFKVDLGDYDSESSSDEDGLQYNEEAKPRFEFEGRQDTIDQEEEAHVDQELKQQYKLTMEHLRETDFKFRPDKEELALRDQLQKALVYQNDHFNEDRVTQLENEALAEKKNEMKQNEKALNLLSLVKSIDFITTLLFFLMTPWEKEINNESIPIANRELVARIRTLTLIFFIFNPLIGLGMFIYQVLRGKKQNRPAPIQWIFGALMYVSLAWEININPMQGVVMSFMGCARYNKEEAFRFQMYSLYLGTFFESFPHMFIQLFFILMNHDSNPMAVISCFMGLAVYMFQLVINFIKLYTDTYDKKDVFKVLSAFIVCLPLLIFMFVADLFQLRFLISVIFQNLTHHFNHDYQELDVDHHNGDYLKSIMAIHYEDQELGTELLYIKSLTIAHMLGQSEADCPAIKVIAGFNFACALLGIGAKIALLWYVWKRARNFEQRVKYINYLKITFLNFLPWLAVLLITQTFQRCIEHLHVKFLIMFQLLVFTQLMLVQYFLNQTVRNEKARIKYLEDKEKDFVFLKQATDGLLTLTDMVPPHSKVSKTWKKAGPLKLTCQQRKPFLRSLISKIRLGGILYYVDDQELRDNWYCGQVCQEREIRNNEERSVVKRCGYGRLLVFDDQNQSDSDSEESQFQLVEGQFLDNKLNGWGRVILPNGNIYQGEFSSGQRSGYGEYSWANGDSYKGEWRDNLKHGFGEYYWVKSEETFIGNFLGGKIKLVTSVDEKKKGKTEPESIVINKEGMESIGSNVIGTKIYEFLSKL